MPNGAVWYRARRLHPFVLRGEFRDGFPYWPPSRTVLTGSKPCLAQEIYHSLNLAFDPATYGTQLPTYAPDIGLERPEFPISCPVRLTNTPSSPQLLTRSRPATRPRERERSRSRWTSATRLREPCSGSPTWQSGTTRGFYRRSISSTGERSVATIDPKLYSSRAAHIEAAMNPSTQMTSSPPPETHGPASRCASILAFYYVNLFF
jgi:hypothetical protein